MLKGGHPGGNHPEYVMGGIDTGNSYSDSKHGSGIAGRGSGVDISNH